MGWNNSVVTKTGIDMLNESLAGYALTISHAAGGSGILDPSELESAVDVVDRKQTFAVPSIEDFEGGKKVCIQITNRDVEEKYILHQIAAFAKLDYQEDASLLFIMQDDRGVEIPSWEENPDFLLEVYAVISISNEANIKVNIDASTVVSPSVMQSSIDAALVKHDESENAHGNIWRAVKNAQSTADAAKKAVTELAGKDQPLIVIGESEPEEGPVFWFDTRARTPEAETVILQIGGDGDVAPVVTEIAGKEYPVMNATPSDAGNGTYEIEIER